MSYFYFKTQRLSLSYVHSYFFLPRNDLKLNLVLRDTVATWGSGNETHTLVLENKLNSLAFVISSNFICDLFQLINSLPTAAVGIYRIIYRCVDDETSELEELSDSHKV